MWHEQFASGGVAIRSKQVSSRSAIRSILLSSSSLIGFLLLTLTPFSCVITLGFGTFYWWSTMTALTGITTVIPNEYTTAHAVRALGNVVLVEAHESSSDNRLIM